jgi:hypothetical protein
MGLTACSRKSVIAFAVGAGNQPASTTMIPVSPSIKPKLE